MARGLFTWLVAVVGDALLHAAVVTLESLCLALAAMLNGFFGSMRWKDRA